MAVVVAECVVPVFSLNSQITGFFVHLFFPQNADTKITVVRVTVQLHNLEGTRTVRLYRDTEL